MIAEFVAFGDGALGDGFVALEIAADREERAVSLVLSQSIENRWCDFGIGTVIERQCDFVSRTWSVRDRWIKGAGARTEHAVQHHGGECCSWNSKSSWNAEQGRATNHRCAATEQHLVS